MVQVRLPDYGYVNARVRAMWTRLLTREHILTLVATEDYDALISGLEKTPYGTRIAQAVLLDPLLPDVDLALQQDLTDNLGKIKEFTWGEPRRLVDLLVSYWDVECIKTILRGKKNYMAKSEILETLVPVGNLDQITMDELVERPGVREVVDTMATLRIVYAEPLTQSMTEYYEKEEDLLVLELALDRFHFDYVLDQLDEKEKNEDMVRTMVTAEIDTRNISTLMRIQETELSEEEILPLCISGGSLDGWTFLDLALKRDVAKVVEHYPDIKVRELLRKAYGQYPELGAIAFEQELEHDLVRKGVAMRNIDVLGIGVIISYLFAKYNEIVNLRIISRGKLLDQSQETIRKELFFVRDGEERAA